MNLPDRAALGTMHGKEAAIAPELAPLGISLTVPSYLDTDALGTFTGEVSRRGSMLDAARDKAKLACEMTGLDFGIGSEGSFGPHPAIPIVTLGREVLVFWDRHRGREIVEQIVDQQPCCWSRTVANFDELGSMLVRMDFPRTSLIVSPAQSTGVFIKGVRSVSELQAAIASMAAQSADGLALVQTDMRANHNPRRMKTIADVASKLAARLARNCPRCGAYGWGLLTVERGLPCSDCGEPTDLVIHEVHSCTACNAVEHLPRADGLLAANPAYCEHCNP